MPSRFSRGLVGACAVLLWAASGVRAQELAVVESSPEDRASADKLSELLDEPVLRVIAAGRTGDEALRCQSSARRELVLDGAHHVVRLIRCRDGTALSRALEPDAAGRAPYLGAFIAAELLAIDRELEAVEAQKGAQPTAAEPGTTQPPAAADAPSSTQTTARVTGATPAPVSAPEVPEPPEPPPAAVALRLAVGADLAVAGAPYEGALRPGLGLGVSLQPWAASAQLLLGVYVSALGAGEVSRDSERVALRRSDAQLRAEVLFPVLGGRLAVGGFAHLRGGLTSAQYSGALETSNSQVRWGLGAGLELDLALTRALGLYVQGLLDLATSRSEYLVSKSPWFKDPASLLWVGAGLRLRITP